MNSRVLLVSSKTLVGERGGDGKNSFSWSGRCDGGVEKDLLTRRSRLYPTNFCPLYLVLKGPMDYHVNIMPRYK